MKALSVCTTHGCPVLTSGGRCEACKVAARVKRPKTAAKGYDARWQATRRAFLAANPYCMCDDCMALPAVMRPAATEVDHIDGLGPLGPRGHDWSNLRSMTKTHHARRTARDQPSGWNDRSA